MALEDIIQPLIDRGWIITFTFAAYTAEVSVYAYNANNLKGIRTKECRNIGEAAIQIRKDIEKDFETGTIW